jgi:spore maturation protein CgeB
VTEPMRITILGLSITSSWGNGHATTYRALVKQLRARGHEVLFLERDVPWYAENRDLPEPPYCRTELYRSRSELERWFTEDVREADLVVVGSYVPEGTAVGEWVVRTARGVTAFYDIDTPVTLAQLARGSCDYLSPALIPRYRLYLSFTGGPTLERLERELGSPAARALYCSVDADTYCPQHLEPRWDLGYLGTYSADRQPGLDRLLLEPAGRDPGLRFLVAGPQYPEELRWPDNVTRLPHVEPARHPSLYGSQRFTLNITRSDMIAAGWSPSVRLFEAAACGTTILSDAWEGLETLFQPGREILLPRSAAEVLEILREMPEQERMALGARARERVLSGHTAAHRARELEGYVAELLEPAS